MNANELAEIIEHLENARYIGASKAATMLRNQQAEIEATATMLRNQQAEIEAMGNRFTLAFWHDTFVEVKKPNSDLIYRFKLDETNDS